MNRITEEMVTLINAGDEKAFSQLYEAYYVYLNTLAIYYVKDVGMASEIVNDIFVNIWTKGIVLKYPVRPYLIKAVQNGCIDHLRILQSQQKTLKGYKEDMMTSYERFILSSSDPFQYIQFNEIISELEKATAQLPIRSREIFKKYFFLGKSVEEIADNMGIQISTVRVQIKNSRERIRKLLKHLESGDN